MDSIKTFIEHDSEMFVKCFQRNHNGRRHMTKHVWFYIIIIIEICKAPTLWLKALNKHTHIMYIEMENVIQKN